MLFEVSCIPYSWGGRWIVSGHSVSQPGSDVVSPPRSEPRCGCPWGTAHTHHSPEDTHIWQYIYTVHCTRAHSYAVVLNLPPGCRKRHKPRWLLSSSVSPELPPGCGLPSHSTSCCPVWQRIHITSVGNHFSEPGTAGQCQVTISNPVEMKMKTCSIRSNGFFSANDRLLLLYRLGGKRAISVWIDQITHYHDYPHDTLQLFILLFIPGHNYEITACYCVTTLTDM